MPAPDTDRPEGVSQPAEDAGVPGKGNVVDAAADLAQTFVTYARQEVGDLAHDKVVVPMQRAGSVIGFAVGAGMVLAFGIGFVSVAVLLVLAEYLGWPGALFLVGGLLLLGASGLTYLKMRSMQS